jgi:hypothetical protein
VAKKSPLSTKGFWEEGGERPAQWRQWGFRRWRRFAADYDDLRQIAARLRVGDVLRQDAATDDLEGQPRLACSRPGSG